MQLLRQGGKNIDMANQYDIDPRQAEFLKNYLDPESDTFGNALQSALLAKYSEEYAKNIMQLMPDWLSENIEDANLVSKAIKNLNDLLDAKDDRVKLDTTKFVAERLNKKKFSARNEHTGKDGEQLFPLEGFNYVKPNNTDNISTPEAGQGLGETTGQDN